MLNVLIVALLLAVAASQVVPWLMVSWISPASFGRERHSGADLLVVDIRTVDEFSEAHLPGAMSVPLRHLRQEAQTWAADASIVVVARTDYGALKGYHTLRHCGVLRVRCLRGGMLGYVRHLLASRAALNPETGGAAQ